MSPDKCSGIPSANSSEPMLLLVSGLSLERKRVDVVGSSGAFPFMNEHVQSILPKKRKKGRKFDVEEYQP